MIAMNTENTAILIKDNSANPAPLGLYAFGMTTVLVSLCNAGLLPGLDSMILAMGIFFGGLAQVIAGIMESRKKNTFGFTAFTSYGFFWLSFVGLLVLPKLEWAVNFTPRSLGAYMFMWGVFTTTLFVATLRINKALQWVFATLSILFFLLFLAELLNNTDIAHIAGYEGILCGGIAIYAATANLLNEVYGKTLLPLGVKN
jgi:succinate-acetate transporter protein